VGPESRLEKQTREGKREKQGAPIYGGGGEVTKMGSCGGKGHGNENPHPVERSKRGRAETFQYRR